MQKISRKLKLSGKSIGFVPTMGFLHEGHLSLVRKSKKTADITVVSIFVNPTQFAPNEDLDKYPRDVKRDKSLLIKEGVDFVFLPREEEIYSADYQTYVEVEKISKHLEGEYRPTHFKGVTTIVTILFNSVNPDFVFFGQKDAQQAAVIKQMIKDLKFDIKIRVCPVVREQDGLAMSSRNTYLSIKERKDALVLSKSLKLADTMIKKGETKSQSIIKEMKELINSVDNATLDYIKVVNADNFEEEQIISKGKKYYILVACRIGNTRLIDNILIKI
jgi:pantoate--beta-alanine ligase